MMEQHSAPNAPNPYVSPSAPVEEAPRAEESGGESPISEQTVSLLSQTRRWLTVYCVVGVLWIGLMALAVAPSMLNGHSGAIITGIGSLLVVALIYGLPLSMLWRYRAQVGEFVRRPNQARFDRVLKAQRRLWRTTGIIALILIALLALFVIGSAVFAFALASQVRY